MPRLIASEVARVTGGRLVGPDAEGSAVVADSREVTAGIVFAAVAGGHTFIDAARTSDAPFVIATSEHGSGTTVVVDDTVAALGALTKMVRDRIDIPVVGITGSTGKTLTKDLVAAALRSRLRVHATPKSYNAELGVPLTVLSMPDDTEVLVLELAARHVGEIAELCSFVRPTLGAITGIGTSHIEEFGSREAIATTKSELLQALPPDGVAVLPSNDDFLDVMVASTGARVVTVGPGGAVRYRAERVVADGRTTGTVTIGSTVVAVDLPVAGRALMRNAAFALAIAAEIGVDPLQAAEAMRTAPTSAWRMEVRHVGGRLVVNDAYNANPASVASSLRAVREMAGDRPAWAVLGRMAELGDTTEDEHQRAGRLAAELGYAGVIVVGVEAAGIAAGAEEAGIASGGAVMRVSSVADAAGVITDRVPPDAVIVVKASRVAGLERLVDELAEVPEAAT